MLPFLRTWEMAQSGQCLLCKHKDLSLSSKTYTKTNANEAETGTFWGDHSTLLEKFQVSVRLCFNKQSKQFLKNDL